MKPAPPRNGFTLIEVTMAVTMGMAIIILAYSAVRAAGQASNAAANMALQTEIIRVAYLELVAQADAGSLTTTALLPAGNAMGLPAVSLTAGTSPPIATNYSATLSIAADPVTGVSYTLPLATHGPR